MSRHWRQKCLLFDISEILYAREIQTEEKMNIFLKKLVRRFDNTNMMPGKC